MLCAKPKDSAVEGNQAKSPAHYPSVWIGIESTNTANTNLSSVCAPTAEVASAGAHASYDERQKFSVLIRLQSNIKMGLYGMAYGATATVFGILTIIGECQIWN